MNITFDNNVDNCVYFIKFLKYLGSDLVNSL